MKKEYVQYLKDDEISTGPIFGEGSHAQTVTLTREEGTALLSALNDLGDIA